MECAGTSLTFFYTNITPIQNNKVQPISNFTFSPVQLHSKLVGTDENTQLTLLRQHKLALTAIKIHFLHDEIIRAPKKFKTQPRFLFRLSSVYFCQIFEIFLMRQSL